MARIHNLCFEQKYEIYQSLLSENFKFLEVKFFYIFEKACFRNASLIDPCCLPFFFYV